MTPSRSAHGHTCERVEVEQVHRRLGDQRAGEQLRRPAGRDTRQLGPLGEPSSRRASACHSARSSRCSDRGDVGAVGGRRRAGEPGQRRNVLRGRHRARPAYRPARRTVAARRPSSIADVLAQRLDVVLVRRVARQPVAGQPAGAQRQRHRDVRLLVDARPRSPASRRRCRAPAAARTTSRTSAAPRGTSAGPRPRRTAPPGPRRSRRAPGQHLLGRWAPRGAPRWRTPAGPRCPGPRRPRALRRTTSTSASAPAASMLPSSVRCSASRSSVLSSTPAAAARRGARPPRAGGRCWTDVEHAEPHDTSRVRTTGRQVLGRISARPGVVVDGTARRSPRVGCRRARGSS